MQKLQEHGVDITYEQLLAEYPGSVLTRAHYARFLLAHGYVKGLPEAFDRYVGDHAPCYIPREKVTPMQAVHLILQSGGVPILAHPILYHMSDERLDKLVATLKQEGLAGIEAIYSTYNAAEERQIRKLAANMNCSYPAVLISTVLPNPDYPWVTAMESCTYPMRYLPV